MKALTLSNINLATNALFLCFFQWATVKGGMSRITECAATILGSGNIHLGSRVERISYLDDGRVELGIGGDPDQIATFDAVVLAMPPSALHSIVDRPRWSFMKEQSIRGTHFEPLYKIGLHFRTRFWEKSSTPALGGQSTTDLRFRWIVYPSNDIGGDGSGVLLLYSWMTDAMKWAGLSPEERIKICLHDLSKFYADEPGIDVHDQYIEAYDVLWMNEFCGGDAMFLPGQFSRYHHVAKQPEGNVYFAGEHLSKHHTWVSFNHLVLHQDLELLSFFLIFPGRLFRPFNLTHCVTRSPAQWTRL